MNSARQAWIVGAGPAGLMAAEVLSSHGVKVTVLEAMPSPAAKFLVAGKGGLNLTHQEPLESFITHYQPAPLVGAWLRRFGPQQVCEWAASLGFPTFVGSSGKVFPEGMEALPLLRAWQKRLGERGVTIRCGVRWLGWRADGSLLASDELVQPQPLPTDPVLFALGGGSWPQTGSDGKWIGLFAQRSIQVTPLRPANCGFDVAWGPYIPQHFAGTPLKNISLTLTAEASRPKTGASLSQAGESRRTKAGSASGAPGVLPRRGECLITETGLEGPLVYALSASIRDRIEAAGSCRVSLDLLPDLPQAKVEAELAKPREGRTWSSFLQRRLGLKGAKVALLRELAGEEVFADPTLLARKVKDLSLEFTAPRPLSEAISSAGGICLDQLGADLMLKPLPGAFCAGEMLDWEAPTGGYLLTACLSSGWIAGHGVLRWLDRKTLSPEP